MAMPGTNRQCPRATMRAQTAALLCLKTGDMVLSIVATGLRSSVTEGMPHLATLVERPQTDRLAKNFYRPVEIAQAPSVIAVETKKAGFQPARRLEWNTCS
jgi:hypothetical protein